MQKKQYVMLCAIWYHLQFKKRENIHGGVSLLVKLQADENKHSSMSVFHVF